MRQLSKHVSSTKWDKLLVLEQIRNRIKEEAEAINRYDEMIEKSNLWLIDEAMAKIIKEAIQHISLEEKMHLTELYELLKMFDSEQRSSEKQAIQDIEEVQEHKLKRRKNAIAPMADEVISKQPRVQIVYYLTTPEEAEKIAQAGEIRPKFSDNKGNYILLTQYAEPVYRWKDNQVILELLVPEDKLVVSGVLPSWSREYRYYGDAFGPVVYKFYGVIPVDSEYVKKRIEQVNQPFVSDKVRDILASFQKISEDKSAEFDKLEINDSCTFFDEDGTVIDAKVIDKTDEGIEIETKDKEKVWINRKDVAKMIRVSDKLSSEQIKKLQNLSFISEISKVDTFRKLSNKRSQHNVRVLMIIAEKDFEDTEYLIPKKIFENEKLTVHTASTNRKAVSMKGKEVDVDYLLDEVDGSNYHVVVVVGGQGSRELSNEPAVVNILNEVYNNNGIVAGICHGVISLAKAGLLNDRRATTYPDDAIDIIKSYGARYKDLPVRRDGRIITGRDPASAEQFAAYIIDALNDYRFVSKGCLECLDD